MPLYLYVRIQHKPTSVYDDDARVTLIHHGMSAMSAMTIMTVAYLYEYAGILLVYCVTYLNAIGIYPSHPQYTDNASITRMCNSGYAHECEYRLQIIHTSFTWIALFLSILCGNTAVNLFRLYWKQLAYSKSNPSLDGIPVEKRQVNAWLQAVLQMVIGATLYHYIRAKISLESAMLYYYYINPFIGGAWLVYQLYVLVLWTMRGSMCILDKILLDTQDGSRSSIKGGVLGSNNMNRSNRSDDRASGCWQSELLNTIVSDSNFVRVLTVVYCSAFILSLSYMYLVYHGSTHLNTSTEDCFCTGYLFLAEAILSIAVLMLSIVSKYINQGLLLPSVVMLYTTAICLQSVLLNPMNYSASGILYNNRMQLYVYSNDCILLVVFACSTHNIMTEKLTLSNSAMRCGHCCSFHVLQYVNHWVQCCLRYCNAMRYSKVSKYKDIISSSTTVAMDQHAQQQHQFSSTYSNDSTELSNRRNNSPKTLDTVYTSAYWNDVDEQYVDESYGNDHENHQLYSNGTPMHVNSSKAFFPSWNGFCMRMLFITCYLQLLLTRWTAVDGTPTLQVFFEYNLYTEVFQYRTHMIQIMCWLGCWILYSAMLLNMYFINMHYHKCREKMHGDASGLSTAVNANRTTDLEQF